MDKGTGRLTGAGARYYEDREGESKGELFNEEFIYSIRMVNHTTNLHAAKCGLRFDGYHS